VPQSTFKEDDMAYKEMAFAFSLLTAAVPVSAAQTDPAPPTGAPAAPSDARYCLRVDPMTGSRMETIRCETREGWAMLDVDVDQEWAHNGVRVVTGMPSSA
jgi:hypothetical protein